MVSLARRAPDSEGIAIGNVQWGVDLVMSSPIRECAPISIWYNFTETGVQLPPDTTLPAAGALSFHTPDEAKDQWMVLSPPMGTGVFAWDSPMTAGQKFVLRGVAGYEDIITVSNNGNGCSRQGPPATTTFEHGTLALPIFTSFLSASYLATTISTTGFLPTTFPSGSFATQVVPLGLAIGAGATGSTTSPPATSQTSPGTSSGGSPPIGAIIGGVLGAVLVVLLALLFLCCWRRRRRKQVGERTMGEVSPLSPTLEHAPSTLAGTSATIHDSGPIIPPIGDRKRRPLEQVPSTSTLRSSPVTATTSGPDTSMNRNASHTYFGEDSFPPTTVDATSTYRAGALASDVGGSTMPAPPMYSRLPLQT